MTENIKVSKWLRDLLKTNKRKGETYEDVLKRIAIDAGHKKEEWGD